MMVDLARTAVGATLLVRPDLPARVSGTAESDVVRTVTRVLGGRYLVQGLSAAARPGRGPRRLDPLVEGAHGLSMLGLGAVSPRYRRLALSSAAGAAAFVLLDLRAR